jgi:hypothetical protein
MAEPVAVANPDHWRRCNSCKKPIAYGATYYVCNVSTCNRKRTGLVFCEVSCWDAHVPGMNHRESWAEERHAPSLAEWEKQLAADAEPKKRERKPREEAAPEAAPAAAASKPRVILRRGG